MADLRERLQPGLADRYRLERELGRGGMATVFLAHDLKHDRPVALKLLHPELAATLGPERFQREIHLAARLQHPHILTVLDSGEAAGQLWFTMPYVEGESLRDRLVREGQLPVEDALRIAAEAARGLEYAHAHGVVHRDIKPENILLTADGSTLVADFGIARALGAGDERLTETGMTVGTPAYMSPEQSAGESNLGPRSDVYSLGCVLYEMLAGEPPFTGPSVQAVMMRRLTESPRPLREQRETVPATVEQAVLRALARAPADRFAGAAQFAQALQATPTPVGTPTVVSPSSQPLTAGRRRRPPVAALSLGLGFLIGLGVLFAWRQSHPSDTSAAGPRRMAVLPFENVGQAADEYFADGVSDAVRGKLAGLAGLEVTARSSAGEYRRTAKPIEEVARELGVEFVLTGRVRWARDSAGGSRVEVSPAVMEIEPGRPAKVRWQQPFVASITDVFQVQADVAARVASALGVAMAAETRARLEERPTASLAAYDAYLKGRSYEERARLNVEPQSMEIARRMYGEAIAADSGFTLAWARLAQAYLYLYERDRTDSTLGASARAAAERAIALAPGSAEARTALGDYLSQTGDRPAALAEYERALQSDPDNPELLSSVALSQYFRGHLDSTLRTSERAAALDPRSAERSLRLGYAYRAMRRYGDAVAAFDRAIALAPDQYHAYWDKAMVLLLWKGDVDAARRTLQEAEARIGKVEFVKKMCVQCFEWTGPLAADYEHVLDQLALDGFSARDSANYYNARASRAYMRGDRAAVRIYIDSVRTITERFVRERPDVPDYRFRLAGVYAGMGRPEDARREYLRYVELRRERGDTLWIGTEAALDMGYLLVAAGRRDEALDSLAHAMADTTYPYYTRQALGVDPYWAWARDDQRFRQVVGTAAPAN